MRLRQIGLFLLLLSPFAFSHPAPAQTASTVDPYEVLYGQKLTGGRMAQASVLDPSLGAVQVLRTRTERLLDRAQRTVSSYPPGRGGFEDKLVNQISKQKLEAERLLSENLPIAAYQEAQGASLAALWTEQLATIGQTLDQIRRFPPSLRSERTAAVLSADTALTLQSERLELDALRARLEEQAPTSVGSFLTVLLAEGEWFDLSALQELTANRQYELSRMLGPLVVGAAEEDRPNLERFMIRFLIPASIQLAREDLQTQWQARAASPSRAGSAMRLGAEGLRKLTEAYVAATRANAALAKALGERRKLPAEEELQSFYRQVGVQQIEQRLARLGQSDAGGPTPQQALALALKTYIDSLYSVKRLELLGVPANAGSTDDADQQKRRLTTSLQRLERQARVSAERVHDGLGFIPEPVILFLVEAQPLLRGTAEEQEQALGALLQGAAVADLAMALGMQPLAPALQDDAPLTETQGGPVPLSKQVRDCVEELRVDSKLLGRAQGFAYKRYGTTIDEADILAIHRDAFFSACTRARDLSHDVRPLYWKIFRRALFDRFDELDVTKPALRRLTASCEELLKPPTPVDDLIASQDCDLVRQGMSKLPQDDRDMLQLWLDEELTYAQLGQRLGISEAAATKRISRAIEKLREFYMQRAPLSQHWLLQPLHWLDQYLFTPYPSRLGFPSLIGEMSIS